LTAGFDAHGDGRPHAFRTVGGAEPRKRGVADLLQKHPGAVLTGAVAVVICAVAVVLMAVWPQKSVGPGAQSSSVSDAAIARPAGAIGTKPSTVESTTSAPRLKPATPVAAAVISAAAAPNVSAQGTTAPPTKDSNGPRRITPTGDDRLSFSFADD